MVIIESEFKPAPHMALLKIGECVLFYFFDEIITLHIQATPAERVTNGRKPKVVYTLL
jgi:hypothetical protein